MYLLLISFAAFDPGLQIAAALGNQLAVACSNCLLEMVIVLPRKFRINWEQDFLAISSKLDREFDPFPTVRPYTSILDELIGREKLLQQQR